MMRRLALAAAAASTCLAIVLPASAQSEPGALRILYTTNLGEAEFQAAIATKPGVAHVDTFDTSSGTPTPEQLATYDLVVSLGDSAYNDAATWGSRLADFVDAGGAVAQFGYDQWASPDAAPTGRWASGGYPALDLGSNDNNNTTLGERAEPSNPLLANVADFGSYKNVNSPLSSGATLLAKFATGKNAIATKGRVLGVAAAGYDGQPGLEQLAQLAVNAGNVLGRHRFTVSKNGGGTGTITSGPSGIDCGATCTGLLPYGTVSFTAAAGPQSVFAGWSGDCGGTGTCSLGSPITGKLVTATFMSTKRCGNPRAGTSGNDQLAGTMFGDLIDGRGGNDTERGGAGGDCLVGGAGADRLFGETGKDSLIGGTGKDRLVGSSGNDRLNGGGGSDRLSGGSGNDRLSGGSGNDRLSGGRGKNVLSGGSGNDVLNIRDGRRDTALCGRGKDRVNADKKDRAVGCEKVRRR